MEGILALLQAGEITPGKPLPPERELCEELGVSRTSLRSALVTLDELGVLSGRWGSGNYVLPRLPELVLQRDEGFGASIRSAGMVPSYQPLDVHAEGADAKTAARLEVLEGQSVLHFRRLVLVDGNPGCLQDSWISLVRCPGLERHDFSRASLYQVLRSEYGLDAHHNMVQVSVGRASDEEGRLLGVEEGTPLLRMEGTSRDLDLVPVECYREAYAPGRIAIVSDSTFDDFVC